METIPKNTKNAETGGKDDRVDELIEYANMTSPYHLYADCLKPGRKPRKWNSARIIIIHKKASKADIRNFTPRDMLPVLYQILTKIITNRLQNKFDKAQPRDRAGFRSGFRTMGHSKQ